MQTTATHISGLHSAACNLVLLSVAACSDGALRGMLPAGRCLLPDQCSVSVGAPADVSTLKTTVRDYTAEGIEDFDTTGEELENWPKWIGVSL